MENLVVSQPPPIVIEHHQQKRGACFQNHCLVIQAPKNKTHKSYEKLRLNYYKNRMISLSKTAQSPDLNLTLNDIKNGFTRAEHAKATLFVYLVGVIVIFSLLSL